MWKTGLRITLSNKALLLPIIASAQFWNQFLDQIRHVVLNKDVRPSTLKEDLEKLICTKSKN